MGKQILINGYIYVYIYMYMHAYPLIHWGYELLSLTKSYLIRIIPKNNVGVITTSTSSPDLRKMIEVVISYLSYQK